MLEKVTLSEPGFSISAQLLSPVFAGDRTVDTHVIVPSFVSNFMGALQASYHSFPNTLYKFFPHHS